MVIYLIVCSENLKLYVGQHKGTDLGRYLSKKFYDAARYNQGMSHLYAAMRKRPRDAWSIHPLVTGVADKVELDALEKHYIRVLKCQHPDVGYNICDGGEGRNGPMAEETKRKIGEANKISMVGNTNGTGNAGTHHETSETHRQHLSAALTGRPKSPEHAQHIGAGHRGLVYNLGNSWNVGRKQSVETIEKRKVANAGFRHSEAAKEKMRKPKSVEAREHMLAAQQARIRTPCPHGTAARKCRACGRARYKKWYHSQRGI